MGEPRPKNVASGSGRSPALLNSPSDASEGTSRSITNPDGLTRRSRAAAPFRFDGSDDAARELVSPTDPGPAATAATPEPRPRLKRPGTGSRRSSTKGLPFRGQEFSVDDDVAEIAAAKATSSTLPKSRPSGSVRRTPSTVRRRPTATAARLPDAEVVEAPEETPDAAAPASASDSFARLSKMSTREDDTAITNLLVDDSSAPADQMREQEEEEVELAAEQQAEEEEDDDETPMDEDDVTPMDDDDDQDDLSDAESFTLKDRQEAINETHPFGIRIWKPALYKKGRSVEKDAEGDIHSAPGGNVSRWLWFFNFAWTLVFGWWLALLAALGALLCLLLAFAPGARDYGAVLWGLAGYLFYPFGKYVKLIQEEAYAAEDEGEGRSLGEYERWQTGDLEEGRLFFGPVRSLVGRRRGDEDSDEDETASLLGRNNSVGGRTANAAQAAASSSNNTPPKRRLFGRGDWNFGRIVFYVYFWLFLTPLLALVDVLCWLLVFTIPMGRVIAILLVHLRRHPLALEFHHDSSFNRATDDAPSSVLLCTYRAVGTKYWKYTVDGTNVILINLLGVVAFVIFDYYVLYEWLGMRGLWSSPVVVFLLALFSIIPLAYFIGQAVASISAQSTMGVGAAINAFFSTVVEVFLYCVALSQGKSRLVEGSIIGSIFAGILFLPGISMCFGAIKRKTQRFNVKSAGVTTTMLLFAVIGAFGPTLFYQIFGSHEMNCHKCKDEHGNPLDQDCRKCYFAQIPSVHDRFYINAVQPFTWFAALLLFLAYVIGLLFTLRTHAATIWNTEIDEKKAAAAAAATTAAAAAPGDRTADHASRAVSLPSNKIAAIDYGTLGNQMTLKSGGDVRESQLYRRILSQSLRQVGVAPSRKSSTDNKARRDGHVRSHASSVSMTSADGVLQLDGLTAEDSDTLLHQMAEMAATAATVASRDAVGLPRRASAVGKTSAHHHHHHDRTPMHRSTTLDADGHIPHGISAEGPTAPAAAGGHDAPNWSRTKSYTILLSATVAYAIIAEILVNTVDAVLANVDIDEKFIGITLFALVPNTTEFLNAISFAMNGNIALSMEIGSAYALQVCLLQIPALVLFSAVYALYIPASQVIDHTFVLLFPQWDMVTVILCVFLLSYMYGEGKSNYFKGSILILSYFVVVVGFYLSDYSEATVADPNSPRRHHRQHLRVGSVNTANTWAHSDL